MPILGITASSVFIAPTAFESIATVNGTGASSVITFSNIPSGYQHLQIRYIAKGTRTTETTESEFFINFNGNAGANYSRHALRGNGSTATASGVASQTGIGAAASIPTSAAALANMFAVGIIDIHDYLSTSKNKTLRGFYGVDYNRTSGPVGNINLISGLFFATPAAITSISFDLADGSWTTTSQFALYGIKGS